jgi:hypothetical protein
LRKIDLFEDVETTSQDTQEILASLTLVTDIFTISAESSGIVAEPPHDRDRDAGMTARRVHLHDLVGTAGRLPRRARVGMAGRAGA